MIVRPSIRLLFILILGMSGCCQQRSPLKTSADISPTADLPEVLAVLQRDWLSYRETLDHHSKDWPSLSGQHLQLALEKLPQRQFQSLLAELNPYGGGNGAFHYHLLAQYVVILAERGDREGIINLITGDCPEYVGTSVSIEEFLANCSLHDPVGILKRAYEIAPSPGRKAFLAAMLACAFPTLKKDHPNEGEFVRACAEWYETNKSHLVVNQMYEHQKDMSTLPSQMELFVEAQK